MDILTETNKYLYSSRQKSVAELEQILIKVGVPPEQAPLEALNAFETYFSQQLKKKGITAAMAFVIPLLFIYILSNFILTHHGGRGIFAQTLYILPLVTMLLYGIVNGMRLWAIKEEITSFRELRKL
ncbi:hypothetical protein CK934_18450 [Chitinophaga sp. MD30]|nr:hypothetical protein CK934_18450 [Chitinophaga sp. MD30]